ncbi:MAG: pyruvate kinase [Pirellulaceae bacterium]
MALTRPNLNEARSKIVATIGPACDSVEMLHELVKQGVDVFRINAAHGKIPDFERILGNIRKVRELSGFPIATLLDLSGPKIRLGQLAEEHCDVEVGRLLTFVRGEQTTEPYQLCSNYARLIDEVVVGNQIMLADGTITLKVLSKSKDTVVCEAITAGVVRSRQGINLPGVTLSVSAMRPEDVENAIWGARNEIDFISLSFVRSPEDVTSLKNLLASLDSHALVVAKIEKREALERLEAIVDAADAVMVARGDLGVEIDVAETPSPRNASSPCAAKN